MKLSMRALALSLFTLPLVACAAPGVDESLGAADEAISDGVCPDAVPAALTPAADQTLAADFTGDGVQIYSCNATATGYAWVFIAPEANLLNHGGDVVGTHYAGPTWEADDGSKIVGAKVAAASSPDGAIPWLLLKVVSHGGPDGRFSDVTSVQRLETVGGTAPATGCDADHAGATARVPYTAHYVFYRTQEEGRVTQCGGS
jgi:Protein of unknown function (DUF3455)